MSYEMADTEQYFTYYYEGYLTAPRKLKLPNKPPPRDRWLTRSEVARLLWTAYRNPKTKHLARYIMVAVHTGTRSESILGLRFIPSMNSGWVDTQAGIMDPKGMAEVETKKKRPTIPIPRRLLNHMKRWERSGAEHVVEFDGSRVASIKNAWKTLLAESGVEHCTRHDLRHTAITWAMMKGMSTWQAAGYFGLSTDMIDRVYGHHSPEFMESALAVLEQRR